MGELKETRAGFAEIGGAQIYYESAGTAEGRPPVALVHAGICDGRMWDAQFASFAERHEVLRYDRRGFGKTGMVAGSFSHHQDLSELLKSRGFDRASLVGCSQGAKIALDLALEHPEAVASLVLVAPSVSGFELADDELPAQWDELVEADARGDVTRVNELELQIWVDGSRPASEKVDARVRELVREMNLIALSAPPDLGVEQELDPPAVNRLREVRAPVLVVVGDYDTPKTIAAAELLASQIPNARKVVMPGTAHLPNMEQPARFNGHVLSFLGAPG